MYAAGKQIALACFSMILLAQMLYQAVSSIVLCQLRKPTIESVAVIVGIASEVPLVSIFRNASCLVYSVVALYSLLCIACM